MNQDIIVPIIMGSKADLSHAQAIVKVLTALGIHSELRIGSAHKAPLHVLRILEHYEADPRPKVYITIAGRSNALSGAVDARVSAPVIACPPYSDSFGGADIFSSIRTPSGVAPALVLDPDNAALLAAKILALGDKALAERVRQAQEAGRNKVIDADAWLRTLS